MSDYMAQRADDQIEGSIHTYEAMMEEIETLHKAYKKMRNSAAGYSNLCDEDRSTRSCDRLYNEAEELYSLYRRKV